MLTCWEKHNKLTSVSWTILVLIFLNVSVRLKFNNCFFSMETLVLRRWGRKNQYGFINWFDKAEVSSISFTWSVSYRNSRQWAVHISNSVGKKNQNTQWNFWWFPKIFLQENIFTTHCPWWILFEHPWYKQKVFYIRLQSKIPCTLSISQNWIRVLHLK